MLKRLWITFLSIFKREKATNKILSSAHCIHEMNAINSLFTNLRTIIYANYTLKILSLHNNNRYDEDILICWVDDDGRFKEFRYVYTQEEKLRLMFVENPEEELMRLVFTAFKKKYKP